MKKSEKLLVEAVLSKGDFLANKQLDFNDQYVVRANNALYALLSEIMVFGSEILSSPHKSIILKSMRNALQNKHGIKTQSNSPDLLIIVKYIVRTNRKNAHVYARVIDLAIRSKIQPSDLPEFIKSNGGIERIRESNAAIPAVNSDEKNMSKVLDLMVSCLYVRSDESAYASFKPDHKFSSEIHDAKGFGNFSYAICDYVGGEYKVVGFIPMDYVFEEKLLRRVASYEFGDSFRRAGNTELIKKGKQRIENLKIGVQSFQIETAKTQSLAANDLNGRVEADAA